MLVNLRQVVKVIWHSHIAAADGWFNCVHQVAWRHLVNTTELCLLQLTRATTQTENWSFFQLFLHSSWQNVIGHAQACPSPSNCHLQPGSKPHLIHASLGPPESITGTQTASWSVQPFLHRSRPQTQNDFCWFASVTNAPLHYLLNFRVFLHWLWSPCGIRQTKPAARGSLKTQDTKKSPKIAIWAPSHNFVGLYLCN